MFFPCYNDAKSIGLLVLQKLTHAIPRNMGYGAALRTGFAASRKDLVFYTDGDGQYGPKELAVLLPLMTREIDFVNGIKMSRKDPTYRIMLGNWYSLLARWLFWLPIYDVDCDFRLLRRSLLNKLTLTSNSGAICVELVKKAQLVGARFRQVSVRHYERKHGNSQFFQVRRLYSTLTELLLLWFILVLVVRE